MIDKTNIKTTNWLTIGMSAEKLAKEKAKAIKSAEKELARKAKKAKKKEMRAYRKMYRRHRKELVKHAKETREWDYGWLYDSTIMRIRHMYEYYTESNNVHQVDESRLEIVAQLKHVLDLNDEMEHLWDDHAGGHIVNEDGSISATDESLESFKQKMSREQELYEEIFAYIGRQIQWWWD